MRFVSGFLALFFSFNSYGDFEYYKCNGCAADYKMAVWTGPLTQEAVMMIYNDPYFKLSYPEFAEDSDRKTEFIFLSMRWKYLFCIEQHTCGRKKKSAPFKSAPAMRCATDTKTNQTKLLAESFKYAIERCVDRSINLNSKSRKAVLYRKAKVKGGFWRLYRDRDEINFSDGVFFNAEPELSILKAILGQKSKEELIYSLTTEDWKTELSHILEISTQARERLTNAERQKFEHAVAERLHDLQLIGVDISRMQAVAKSANAEERQKFEDAVFKRLFELNQTSIKRD